MFKLLSYSKYYLTVLFKNWTHRNQSYAQHGEDELIELIFPSGVSSFIDIGANDGVLFSNTYKFSQNGAFGLYETFTEIVYQIKIKSFFTS